MADKPATHDRRDWLRDVVARKTDGNVADFASKYKLDYTGLVLMLNGKRPISDKSVIKVCNRAGVQPPEGFGTVPTERIDVAPAPDAFAQERQQYLRIIEGLQKELEASRARLASFNDVSEKLDRLLAQAAK